jgi:hypothetical protein
MDQIVIEGVPPYDGRYEFELRDRAFSVREWGWIKRHTGYLPLTLDDGLAGVDAELLAIFGIIALVRAGKVVRDDVAAVWERFADAPGVITIRLELEGHEDEAEAPDPPTPPSSTASGGSSGNGLKPSSDSSVELPPVIGTPDSVTSESPRAKQWQS